MAEMSPHERNILRFIERYRNKHGISPTIEEIRVGVGMRSKDHVHRELQNLQRRGYLKIKPSASRGILLRRTADDYPITGNSFSLPIRGVITAGSPIPLPDPNLSPPRLD